MKVVIDIGNFTDVSRVWFEQMINKEISEIKGALQNDILWSKGAEDEAVQKLHLKNQHNFSDYLDVLKDIQRQMHDEPKDIFDIDNTSEHEHLMISEELPKLKELPGGFHPMITGAFYDKEIETGVVYENRYKRIGYLVSPKYIKETIEEVSRLHNQFEYDRFFSPGWGTEEYKAEFSWLKKEKQVEVTIRNQNNDFVCVMRKHPNISVGQFMGQLEIKMQEEYRANHPMSDFILNNFRKKAAKEAKADAGKPKLSLAPIEQLWIAIARVREYGVKKYEKENWKTVEVSRYYDALYRHMAACLNNPHSVDSESGLPHLYHVGCNLSFILELDKELQDANRKHD